eukprot:CAMPEP_0176041802 /NCGR_PEP_ID=MMETSP0120_2-20121206/20739_1 /TAXON_ID=160619 /ORGANISM="Kryptoperidinium foliaceum, Strain CCMP 1326" /LENGTH=312 /DNA_ID=CAMNT_0017375211 /DNA_START=436 /DNA_END=1371 /DNA_ORIENTATION=+
MGAREPSDVEAQGGVHSEQARDEIFDGIADEIRQLVVGRQDLFVEVRGVLVLKREIAADHREQDHTAAPQIAHLGDVLMPRNHFGRSIARRAACGAQPLAIAEQVAQAEVDDLDPVILVQEQVLGLQVPVHDVHGVDLLDTGYDLVEEATRLRLLDAPVRNDVIEQLVPGRVLHDQVQLAARLNNLEQLDDVWMPDQLQDVDFARHPLDIGNLLDTVFLQDFDRDARSGEDVSAELNLAERALADGTAQDVVADGLRIRPLLLLHLLMRLRLRLRVRLRYGHRLASPVHGNLAASEPCACMCALARGRAGRG